MSPTQGKPTATMPGQRQAPEESREETEATEQQGEHGMTLPIVNARVPVPGLGLPSASGVTGRALWLGGLGALAVVGVLDWPVAAAIAAGTWIAEQRSREQLHRAATQPGA